MKYADAIYRAQEVEPRLTYFGLGIYDRPFPKADDPRFATAREEMFEAQREFADAYDFLGRLGRTKEVNPRASSSYNLKHCAERWAGDYVSNGMLIAAAIVLGFKMKPCHWNSPNVWLNISVRSLRSLTAIKRDDLL